MFFICDLYNRISQILKIHFYNTGSIASISGGYIYNKEVIKELEKLGHTIIYSDEIEQLSSTSLNIVDSLILKQAIPHLNPNQINIALLHQVDYSQKSYPFTHSIVTSRAARIEVLGYSNLTEDTVDIIEPGIETTWKQKTTYSDKIRNLLSVSNYIDRKGLDLLIEACARLAHLEWSLTIVGDQSLDAPYFSTIEEKVKEYKLSDRIELCGPRSREEINHMMITSDFLIQPAKHETYGMAVYEGIISQLPVLMYKTGAWQEFGKSKWVTFFDTLNVETLTRKLNEILENYTYPKDQFVDEIRSWKTVALDFEALIKRLESTND